MVQSKLKDLTRTVKIKGFRTGKVPLKVVQQQYGSQVRQVATPTEFEAEVMTRLGVPACERYLANLTR